MPFDLISGKFIPEKSNIWRDCVDGYYDWVKEHISEGAPLNEAVKTVCSTDFKACLLTRLSNRTIAEILL